MKPKIKYSLKILERRRAKAVYPFIFNRNKDNMRRACKFIYYFPFRRIFENVIKSSNFNFFQYMLIVSTRIKQKVGKILCFFVYLYNIYRVFLINYKKYKKFNLQKFRRRNAMAFFFLFLDQEKIIRKKGIFKVIKIRQNLLKYFILKFKREHKKRSKKFNKNAHYRT